MVDDVLINKAASIERCVARALKEYLADPASFADSLKRIVGFHNIAVHDYQSLQMPITLNIITQHLDDFLLYSATIISIDNDSSKF